MAVRAKCIILTDRLPVSQDSPHKAVKQKGRLAYFHLPIYVMDSKWERQNEEDASGRQLLGSGSNHRSVLMSTDFLWGKQRWLLFILVHFFLSHAKEREWNKKWLSGHEDELTWRNRPLKVDDWQIPKALVPRQGAISFYYYFLFSRDMNSMNKAMITIKIKKTPLDLSSVHWRNNPNNNNNPLSSFSPIPCTHIHFVTSLPWPVCPTIEAASTCKGNKNLQIHFLFIHSD